jgi:hypothetical protein
LQLTSNTQLLPDTPRTTIDRERVLKRTGTHLGDAHNFGRRVTLGKTRVAKPRALLWEWLLLSAESPLRTFLATHAEANAFSFLPDLAFVSPRLVHGGEVERVELTALKTLKNKDKRALAEIVGRALGLFSWLGVSDLHWENLVLGTDDRGQMIFAPLDVEMILSDMSLPTETKLLPDADPEVAAICQHACGVRRVLPYLGKPIATDHLMIVADSYRQTLMFLDQHSKAIADIFAKLPKLAQTPIRILLRGTDEYVRVQSQGSKNVWPPLLDAEQEQLARDDIPYFFRLYGKPGIHYYGNETLTQIKRLPLAGDVPQLDPMLDVSRGLKSRSRKKLREDGLFAVIGAFDHPNNEGRHETAELEISFNARTLVVKLRSGEELQSRRNLSAFVGSVYQPCQCGEVRSVFVPAVTVCDAWGTTLKP